MIKNKTPYYDEDTQEFLGFIVTDGSGWQTLTIFGYLIAHAGSQQQAELVLRQQGLSYLKGVWQYYDEEDKDWFYCVIKKAFEQYVTVNRTNALGYQDPEDYKQVVIENPSEITLIK